MKAQGDDVNKGVDGIKDIDKLITNILNNRRPTAKGADPSSDPAVSFNKPSTADKGRSSAGPAAPTSTSIEHLTNAQTSPRVFFNEPQNASPLQKNPPSSRVDAKQESPLIDDPYAEVKKDFLKNLHAEIKNSGINLHHLEIDMITYAYSLVLTPVAMKYEVEDRRLFEAVLVGGYGKEYCISPAGLSVALSAFDRTQVPSIAQPQQSPRAAPPNFDNVLAHLQNRIGQPVNVRAEARQIAQIVYKQTLSEANQKGINDKGKILSIFVKNLEKVKQKGAVPLKGQITGNELHDIISAFTITLGLN
jgi:hypothetical protein